MEIRGATHFSHCADFRLSLNRNAAVAIRPRRHGDDPMAYYRDIPLSKPEIDAVSKLITDVLKGENRLTTANMRFYLRSLLQKLDESE